MGNIEYKLRYLPIFYEDLEKSVVYIAENLQNIQAANNLLDEVYNDLKTSVDNHR